MRVSDAILWVDGILLSASIGWALVVAYLQSPNYVLLRRLFWVIALGIGIFVIVWDVTATQSAWVRVPFVALASVAIGVFVVEGTRWTYREATSHQRSEGTVGAHPLVFQEQLAEIKELEKFIAQDEIGLRNSFDIPTILDRNIMVQNIRIGFRSTGKLQDFRYDNYTEGDHSFIMLTIEGKYHPTPSGPSIDDGPRDVLYLITTTKYQDAQKRINNFLNSALVPDSIKAPLVEFNKTIGKDIEIMIRALNAIMNENDDYFLKYNEI
jgi:hypothetical protein